MPHFFLVLRKTRCPASAVDRDRAPLLGRTGLALFHRDREHAVLESGLDRVLVGIGRQVQSALKATVGALHPVETAVFRFLLLTLFTAHQQHVVVERDLDVFSSTPGTSRAILYCLSVSWMSSAGFSMPGQSDGQRGMASVGKPKPRNASSNRRSISRCNCRMGLTGPPDTCRSLRCTSSEAVLCCSSCSF